MKAAFCFPEILHEDAPVFTNAQQCQKYAAVYAELGNSWMRSNGGQWKMRLRCGEDL